MTGRPNAAALALAFCAATLTAALGIGVRTSFGFHVAADEPQYLLTALSLFEDQDLDIADEITERRWTAFGGTGELPRQTAVLADGRELSPHDVLLPLLLAVPMGLGGWVAAKATLSVLAGVLAAVVLWVAVRRFGVAPRIALPGVLTAFASPPLAVYGQQVYPELPAALAVTIAVAALTGRLSRPAITTAAAAITALPWLSVKYLLPAAALAGLAMAAVRRARGGRSAVGLALGLGGMGALYLLVHQIVWGGWTAYASGAHFQESGEQGVVIGARPDAVERLLRLVGLLTDRGYGLVAWQPAWLLVPVALGALARTRGRGALTLTLPLAGGWLTATFVAATMGALWWPGRQLVVVLPLALLVVVCWAARASAVARMVALAAGGFGVAAYGWLLTDGYARRLTWGSGFQDTGYPFYRPIRPLLTAYRHGWDGSWIHLAAWIVVFALLAGYGWRTARRTKDDTELGVCATKAPVGA